MKEYSEFLLLLKPTLPSSVPMCDIAPVYASFSFSQLSAANQLSNGMSNSKK